MDISEVLKIPLENRDEVWEQSFLNLFPHTFATLDSGIPSQEFDGWPYLHITAPSDSPKGEPAIKVIDWLCERGIGLILNSYKSQPDYVFTYGMLWSFRSRGNFLGLLSQKSEGSITVDPSSAESVGAPSTDIFPQYARSIVRQFLLDQGIVAPKILVISENNRDFDLCFSVESLGYPPEKEHAGILEALAWFFPPDYSLVMVREANLPRFELL